PSSLFKALKPTPSKKRAADGKDIKMVRLKNGVKLLLKENLNLPLVSVRLANMGGLRSEAMQKNGVHSMLAQTLTKGTKTLNSEALAVEIEQMAASIDAFSGRNLDGLQGDFLSDKIESGLDLFLDVLLNPAFDPKEIEKERRNTLEALRREQYQLSALAYKN